MRNSLKKIVLIFGFFCFYQVGYAALELELTQGVEGAIPLGLNQFEHENLLQESISSVVENDLQMSGRVRVKRGESFLSEWRKQGVETILLGRVEKLLFGKLQVYFELIDPVKNQKIVASSFAVKAGYERQLAHHISDIIYKALTGDMGFFSTRLAYIVTNRATDGNIYHSLEIADADGHNAKVVMKSPQPLMSPSWSQDGKSIAIVSFENRRSSIYSINILSGERKLITQFPGINGAPAWSPDGSKLAIVLSKSGQPKIYVLDLKTHSIEQKTFGISIDTEPAWAPDGKSFVFTSDRGGKPQIYRLSLAGNQIERVTYEGDYNARAQFSPDGKFIVMIHRQGGIFNIAMQDLSTGEVSLLSQTGLAESPSISPNGKMVIYASTFGTRGILNLISTDGRVRLRLPSRVGNVQEPAWSPYIG